MELTLIFGMVGVLLVVAYIANRLSRLTRVPDLVVLLLIGVTLGPILHWVRPAMFQGAIDILGTLALILILFAGGAELRLQQAARYAPAALLLMIVSYGLSLGLIALMGRALLHLQWSDCVLLGAALGCTSGTIVIPALEQISTPESVKITLTLESTMGEVIAVLLIGSLLNADVSHSLLFGVAADFSRHIVIALLLGVLAGAIWSRLWPLLASHPNANIANLGVVFGVYALARYVGGSGLLAVLIFGITLANLPRTPHMARQGARLLAFHAELSFLVRSFFFVLLGFVAEFVSRKYLLPIAGILAALLLARFLAMQTSRWAVRDVARRETELLFWMLPRGLVTAVLALAIVSARGEVFAFLPAMAFTVVLVTNLFVVAGAVRSTKTWALVPSSTGSPSGMEELTLPSIDVPGAMKASTASEGET
ncbi:MAG: cation:proton antiporter [Candidatus Korobacteraceae bacterium]